MLARRGGGWRFVAWRHAPSAQGDGKLGCADGTMPIWGKGAEEAAWEMLAGLIDANSPTARVDDTKRWAEDDKDDDAAGWEDARPLRDKISFPSRFRRSSD